eukprot:CAMPEP_0114510796 /NCGR_PEP_ID=MMETSP0109-20121206/14003_1 /TAXON_ID=29199 /ORGANISM="Chlorarachnion reptans, Strain CCCM449" /LENGTH=260 /DNA_ID=CAMNT_0001690177 /DNA_START=82 /DNA_END=861 /DNA_ORIENTATION=-
MRRFLLLAARARPSIGSPARLTPGHAKWGRHRRRSGCRGVSSVVGRGLADAVLRGNGTARAGVCARRPLSTALGGEDGVQKSTAQLTQRNRELEVEVEALKKKISALEKSRANSEEDDDAKGSPAMVEFAMSYHEEHHEIEGWRGNLLKFMHSPTVQNTVVGLLIVDIGCVISEIALEHAAHEGGFHVSHQLEHILHTTSLSIMWLFMGEICLYIIGKGPLRFFTQPLEVLDLIVVAGSLYSDMHFHAATGQLLMLFRIW